MCVYIYIYIYDRIIFYIHNKHHISRLGIRTKCAFRKAVQAPEAWPIWQEMSEAGSASPMQNRVLLIEAGIKQTYEIYNTYYKYSIF